MTEATAAIHFLTKPELRRIIQTAGVKAPCTAFKLRTKLIGCLVVGS